MEQVQIPPELINLLTGLIVAGVTWLVVNGFKGLGEAFGKDFSNAAKVIAVIVSASVVSAVFGVSDVLLSLIPVEYAPIVQHVLSLLVVVFGAMGIQRKR